mmetsp:Transcript_145890/g.406355  ORF Transcript_145890/g.406355 Transcript_145890/m.406355 type:complete len:596 (-) Transcript_145890:105-1892(-)
MPCQVVSGRDQFIQLGIVLGLTTIWWACAVGVTVVLKVALGSDPDSDEEPGAWSFPYPLTLTLLANVGTAITCGLLASVMSRNGLGDGRPRAAAVPRPVEPQPPQPQPRSSPFAPTPRTMIRASSREALLQDGPVAPDIASCAAALARGDYAGCPGGALASCGCWSRRRKQSGLSNTVPLEFEMLAEPEVLLALPPPEEGIACTAPAVSSTLPAPRPLEALISHLPGTHFRHLEGVAGAHGTIGHHDPGAHHGPPNSAAAAVGAGGPGGASAQEGGGAGEASGERHVALITMGLIQGLALGAKNEALLLLSVSTRTMIFATNVLVVMLIARLFGLETLKKTKLVAALLLAVGGMFQGFATWQRMQKGDEFNSDEPLGYALAFLALVLDAMRWVLLQAVFSQEEPSGGGAAAEGTDRECSATVTSGGESSGSDRGASKAVPLSKLQMVSWVMWTTTPVCLGLSVFFEPKGLEQASRQPVSVFWLVALLTAGVMGINLAEFGIVQWTSAVTFNVLSQLHGIPLVMAGVTFFGEHIVPVQVLGFGICVLGAVLYSFVKAQEKRLPQPPTGGPEQGDVVEVPVASYRRRDDLSRRQGYG